MNLVGDSKPYICVRTVDSILNSDHANGAGNMHYQTACSRHGYLQGLYDGHEPLLDEMLSLMLLQSSLELLRILTQAQAECYSEDKLVQDAEGAGYKDEMPISGLDGGLYSK